jgi:hypothetical protein
MVGCSNRDNSPHDLRIIDYIIYAHSSVHTETWVHNDYEMNFTAFGFIGPSELQLPLRQWGAGNVYLLLLSKVKK